MVEILPEWNGNVVGVMHRMWITNEALAKEMGVQRTYVSKVLNSPHLGVKARSRVEDALRSLAEQREINFDELWRNTE